MDKTQEFDTLMRALDACRTCESRFGFEPRPVVRGTQQARVMQIGQAPSRRVHLSGLPFDDASGQKLRHEWYQITDAEFYDPTLFYITSVGHCYPGKAKNGGDNPPPKICAKTWLAREIELVDNELYILIGGAAAGFFFPGEPLTQLVFRNLQIRGKPAYVLPHPSPLNIKWFKDHPEFLDHRIQEVRAAVHAAISPA